MQTVRIADLVPKSRLSTLQSGDIERIERAVAVVAANKSWAYRKARAGVEIPQNVRRPSLELATHTLARNLISVSSIPMVEMDDLVDQEIVDALQGASIADEALTPDTAVRDSLRDAAHEGAPGGEREVGQGSLF